MPDYQIPPVTFDNQLAYDLIVYDSFDYDDDDDDSASPKDANSQSYFATLTQLGRVPAGKAVSLQPIHDPSAYVVESASDNKPVKHLVSFSDDDVTSVSIVPDDEVTMTRTFQFVSFFLNNPNDPISIAFSKVLNDTTADLLTGINAFFAAQPGYEKCSFEDYMMALAYSALHPAVPTPSQPAGSSSLKIISELMGSKWADALGDIFVTKFSISNKDKKLVLTFELDISTLPFETADIASNVLTMLNGTKTVKAQILFNYAIGLNIFGTRLSLLFDAMTIPIGDDKTLAIKKPSASIDINPLFKFVVFTLEATFPFNINGKTFDALASFVIDNDEAAIGVDIQGDKSSLPPPPGLKGLFFDEFGVGMALFFKPPGFGIGIEGKFHIGVPAGTADITLDDDKFALVCEFVEEAIQPKYIAFSIPQLNLNEVVQLFTNASPKIDLPVSFTDLSFHWSDKLMDAVALPDGTLSQGGYGFSAAVDVFSFGFYGAANLDLNNGLTANMEVSPINWKNIFKLEGDGKGFSLRYDVNGNPIPPNFVATTQADKDALASAVERQIVAPGGANLIINTLSMPILHLNAKASLFDLLDYAVTADINKDGIKFELDYGAVLTQQMICNLTDFHNFYGQFGYLINRSIPIPSVAGVNIGSIPLNADASLHLAINTSLTDVVLKVGGQFDFEGYHFSFGDYTADINISKISDFLEAIIQYIKNEAKSIFSQIVDTAEHWAAAAKKGIITAYDDAGKVLNIEYKKLAQDTANILKGAGFAVNDIANALKNGYGAASQDVAAVLKAAGFTADEIGAAIKNAWNCGIDDVSWALKQVGYGAADVANSVKTAFNAGAQDVTNTLKRWSYAADDVACVIKDVFKGDSIAVADIMKKAGYAVDDISRGIKDAWKCTANDVTYALKAIGYNASEVATSLKNVFNAASQDVAAALKAMGYLETDVANGIKDAWNCGINDVSWAMHYVGYATEEITAGLKSAFNAAAQDVTNSLKWLGIGAQDAANAMKSVYNLAINATAGVLKQAGYAANDVASALQGAFNASIDDVASAMKQVGYAANDVASALKSAFNTSVDAVADAMKQVGYAADDVKKAFDELGGDFKSFADKAWGDVTHYLNPSNW